MVGYNLIDSNSINSSQVSDCENPLPNPNSHLYHQYHFIQQQQHFQYLQNALANTMVTPQSPSQQHQQDEDEQLKLHQESPYHPNSAVFKPNYMQDVLLNETCIINSPLNSMDGSACTTTKTTPLMHPITVHEFDQLSGNKYHDQLQQYHLPHDPLVSIAASTRSGSISTDKEDKESILQSPSSPMTNNEQHQQQHHEDYLNFVTSFSIHPQSTSSLVFRNHHHIRPAVRHASYDLGCSSSSSIDNITVTPESSPSTRKGLFENMSTKFPIIPSSPTFPAALSLSHGNIAPRKMSKQNGPTLQPPFEIKKMTTVNTNNSVTTVNSNNINAPVAGFSKSKSLSRKSFNNPIAQGQESMKKKLLARYSTRLIQRMKLSESDTKCRKHCDHGFTNYLELINHYEDNGLYLYLAARNFTCPVDECPMNLIGFEKRADLRHHVHSDHLTHGLVSAQYSKYSDEIQKYLFICDEPSCGKGFYRSDTLTRHVKLVHKRTSNFTRKRRRVSNPK